MQFKVPQNVQREDTIIANITIKQLVILLAGGGLDYIIYIGFTKKGFGAPFWFPPVLIIGLLTVAFAFIKINSIPFHKYLLLAIERYMIPQKRMWKKGAAEVYRGIFAPKNIGSKKGMKEKQDETKEKKETLSRLGKLSQVLDTVDMKNTETHKKIEETPDSELLHVAFGTGIDTKSANAKKEAIKKIIVRPKEEVVKPEEETKQQTAMETQKAEPATQKVEKEKVISKPVMQPTEKVKTENQTIGKIEKQEDTAKKDEPGVIDFSKKQGTIELKK